MKRVLVLLLCLSLFAGCTGKTADDAKSSADSSVSSSKTEQKVKPPEVVPDGSRSENSAAFGQQDTSEKEVSSPKSSSSQPEESASSGENFTGKPVTFPETKEISGGLEYTFDELPLTAKELEGILDQSDARHTAALFMATLLRYVDNPQDGIAMIDILRGPQAMSEMDKKFLTERLSDKSYLPASYFEGANPQNNYIPKDPFTLIIYNDPVTAEEEYMNVQVLTTGADTKRRIVLREKDGNYYLWDYPGILSGIRLPANEDPWS